MLEAICRRNFMKIWSTSIFVKPPIILLALIVDNRTNMHLVTKENANIAFINSILMFLPEYLSILSTLKIT